MKVGIVGAGGTGGYFAARWWEAGLKVTLIGRGAHLDAMRASGLTLTSPLGDVVATPALDDDPSALADADVVVFTTKTWQLDDAAAAAAPHLKSDVVVFGVQNGVGSIEQLGAAAGPARVLGATCRIISLMDGPGVIRHVGVDPTIVIGEPGGGVSERVRRISAALSVGRKLTVEAAPDVMRALWEKLLFFAPVSGLGSVTGTTIGTFRSDPEGRRMLRAAISEVAAVAQAQGIDLGKDAVDRAIAFVDTVPAEGTTSMHRDFEAGRRTELDALSGAVSRLGASLGVPTPTHDFIARSLMPRELAARR